MTDNPYDTDVPGDLPVEERDLTITGIWMETGEVFTFHCRAAGPDMAMLMAREHARDAGGTLLFGPCQEGHHDDVSPWKYADPSAQDSDEFIRLMQDRYAVEPEPEPERHGLFGRR